MHFCDCKKSTQQIRSVDCISDQIDCYGSCFRTAAERQKGRFLISASAAWGPWTSTLSGFLSFLGRSLFSGPWVKVLFFNALCPALVSSISFTTSWVSSQVSVPRKAFPPFPSGRNLLSRRTSLERLGQFSANTGSNLRSCWGLARSHHGRPGDFLSALPIGILTAFPFQERLLLPGLWSASPQLFPKTGDAYFWFDHRLGPDLFAPIQWPDGGGVPAHTSSADAASSRPSM